MSIPSSSLSLSLSLSAILMLLGMTLVVVGCGNNDASFPSASEDNDIAASEMITSCPPEAHYDDCTAIDLTQVEFWQNDLTDPNWRSVKPSHYMDVDYKIVIDATQLNGGVIPTHKGQGDYDDVDDYFDTKSALLGIDLPNDTYNLIVYGTTVKKDENGGPVEDSTGVFVYDALSDNDGSIVIDGNDETYQIINPVRQHAMTQEIDHGGHTTTIHKFDAESTANDKAIPTTSDPISFLTMDQQDSSLLGAGPLNLQRQADLRMFRRDSATIDGVNIPGQVTVDLSGVRAMVFGMWGPEYFPPLWIWSSSSSILERHTRTADALEAQVDVTPGNTFKFALDAPEATAVSVSHGWSWDKPSVYEACGFGEARFDIPNDLEAHNWVLTNYVDPNECNTITPPTK